LLTRVLLTCLHTPRLGAQVGEVDVGLPAVDDGVGVFAGPLRGAPVRHGHLVVEEEEEEEEEEWHKDKH